MIEGTAFLRSLLWKLVYRICAEKKGFHLTRVSLIDSACYLPASATFKAVAIEALLSSHFSKQATPLQHHNIQNTQDAEEKKINSDKR